MWLQRHFAAADNLLRFDHFMELALYHEEHGYYSRHLPTIGLAGDFSTSATLSSALAGRVADWIRETSPQHVVEVGAGTGSLSRRILKQLRVWTTMMRPIFRLPRIGHRFSHHIVERSPHLQSVQQRALGRGAKWHPTLPLALANLRGNIAIFANELVDAFPPRVFRHEHGDTWSELFLSVADGAIRESWAPAEALPDSTVFQHRWPEGQRVEVHENYFHWLREWLPLWNTGQLLLIDYGGSPQEIYHRRPSGTLRAFYSHQRWTGTEIYKMPGRMDLTADVNFDDLVRWGEHLGLRTLTLTTQAEFLDLDPATLSPEDHFLTDPAGAGRAFKVLLQEKR